MSFIAAILSAFLGVGAWIEPIQAADDGFHPARTEAERALDAIFDLDRAQTEIVWYAVDLPVRDTSQDPVFSPLFSEALRSAWIEAERAEVQRNCDGHYIEGDLCGLGFSPIICAQDIADDLLYKTEGDGGDMVVIAYRWPSIKEPIATYRMLKIDDRWVMDGVACENGARFNFQQGRRP